MLPSVFIVIAGADLSNLNIPSVSFFNSPFSLLALPKAKLDTESNVLPNVSMLVFKKPEVLLTMSLAIVFMSPALFDVKSVAFFRKLSAIHLFIDKIN